MIAANKVLTAGTLLARFEGERATPIKGAGNAASTPLRSGLFAFSFSSTAARISVPVHISVELHQYYSRYQTKAGQAEVHKQRNRGTARRPQAGNFRTTTKTRL